MIDDVIDHLRNRDYMSGVERDKSRVKATGEVFTPTPLVQEMLDQLPPEVFTDPTKTFLEPSCGDGQFLSEVIIKKMENGSTYEQALSTVYGIDLMEDNCIECIKRLYGVNGTPLIEPLYGNDIPSEWQYMADVTITEIVGDKKVKKTIKVPSVSAIFKVNGVICNIVCGDGLTYDYSFGTYTEPVKTPEQLAKEVKQLKAEFKKMEIALKKSDAALKKSERERLKLIKAQEKAKKEFEQQRIKLGREALAEEKKRLKAESKKKNVVHKCIDEVSDLFGFK